MHERWLSLLVVAAVGATGALAGCGDGGGDDARVPSAADSAAQATPDPASDDATADSSPATSPPAAAALQGASTEPATRAATNTETALLTAVRVATQDGYDRVVFEFRGAVPGFDVRTVEGPIRQDGSGQEMPLEGESLLQVRMENAADADLTDPAAPMTYTGPPSITPDTPQVAELVRVGGFEGILTWAIGLRSAAPFRTTTLDSPPRLVIDIAHE